MTYVGTVTQPGTVKLPPDADLPEGTRVEVTPLSDGQQARPRLKVSEMFGAAKGGFASVEEVDKFIRQLRDEWES